MQPWPIVERFLLDLPPGSIGLDIGCGNGKYLTVNRNVFIVASDRSRNLVDIASIHEPHTAIIADTLSLPHPSSSFDFAISIAVIHHLSTQERRIEAVRSILDILRRPKNVLDTKDSGGRALIFVWALEQKNSRRGWDTNDEQDVMVPWVMKQKKEKAHIREAQRKLAEEQKYPAAKSDRTFHRYYHLYRAGELDRDVADAGGVVLDSGYERDNWWAIAARKTG